MSFDQWCAIVTGALVGVVALGYGLYLRNKLSSCQRWPQTTGTVIQSRLDFYDGVEIDVIYEYVVNGVGYSSGRIKFGGTTTHVHKSSAEKSLSRYPLNSHVTVYYHPENPAEAVLDRTAPTGLACIIFGITCLVLTVLVVTYPGHTTAS